MGAIFSTLKKILLAFELLFIILIENWDKLLFVAIVAADQFVKAIITASMVPGESIPILKHVFHLTYVLNPGAAFGILPNQRIFFIILGITVLAITMMIYSRIKRSDVAMRLGMISMISGAAANLIDRFQNGLVVDFLDFRIWPVFNIADIAIVFGTCFMIYALMFKFGPTKSASE